MDGGGGDSEVFLWSLPGCFVHIVAQFSENLTIFIPLKCRFQRMQRKKKLLRGSKVANGGSRLSSVCPPFPSPSLHTT